MGDVGIEEELDLKGIKYLGGPGDADHKVELKAGYAMPHDPDVGLCSCKLTSHHCITAHVLQHCKLYLTTML